MKLFLWSNSIVLSTCISDHSSIPTNSLLYLDVYMNKYVQILPSNTNLANLEFSNTSTFKYVAKYVCKYKYQYIFEHNADDGQRLMNVSWVSEMVVKTSSEAVKQSSTIAF